ncbi:hypothetical protein G6O67_005248 [Ophiocordyceps sinensis]|nr:hypothetical protein G6O67_005248 [Ophiocordyceps sinensis]
MGSVAHAIDRPRASMGPPPLPVPAVEAKKLDINSLMSPPDAAHDSFSSHAPAIKSGSANHVGCHLGSSTKQPPLMSPPISPHSKPVATAIASSGMTPSSQQIKDPVLYPTDDNPPSSPPQAPLFAPTELEHRRIVDQHVRARSQSIFADLAPPRREDYELALTFRSQVMKHYTVDRKAWLRKERALLEADRRAGAQRYHAIMPAKPITAKPITAKPTTAKPARSQRADRVTKKNQSARNHGAAPARTARPAGRVSATPDPSRRSTAPNREDKGFDELRDYCPPLESLPDRANCLKVDWKGQPISLSGDAYAFMLHPDELLLAGNLRLDCATYLTSKRRIFDRRLQCLRTGKEFRKTDAQQACKIDVNKASKLWTAFEKVGWLDARWVRKYL